MTFKDFRQKLTKLQGYTSADNDKLNFLKDKPFWIWDKFEHTIQFKLPGGKCCFNHIVNCPTKEGKEYPLFDYEKLIYDSLSANLSAVDFKNKHLYVLKATGLGITEFMLRFMAWLCIYDSSYRNSQTCTVTGPNQDIAIKLIKA